MSQGRLRTRVVVCLVVLGTLPRAASAADVILRAADAPVRRGSWTVVADSSAAGGSRITNPDLGVPKPSSPSPSPTHYFELSFNADAGVPYHLWLRGKAENDSYDNDSVWVQFSDSVTSSGAATWTIGSTSAASVVLEDCAGCGLSGWGWQDNGFAGFGAHIYFAMSGTHTIRVQVREDGLSIDQIVLSSSTYLTTPPGALKNDTTILTGTSGASLVRGPYLQQVRDRSATIVWATRENGSPSARVGTQTFPGTTTFFPASQTGLGYDYYQHQVSASGLAAATDYAYTLYLGGTAVTSGSDHLKTAPARGTGSVRFIVFGDSGTGSTEQQTLASLIDADAFDVMLHAGDITYGNSGGTGDASYRTYQSWFFDIYQRSLRSHGLFPSMGNHDARETNEWGRAYLNLFVLPPDAGTGPYPDHAERYYSFDYGPVHFVVLDTELAFLDPDRRSVQLDWLRNDLAATTQPWKIALYHRPPYSSGGEHGSDLAIRDAFGSVFEAYGVQLSLSGHEHNYQRTVPWRSGGAANHAVTYVVTGGGGGPLYPAGIADFTATAMSRHHYVRALVSGCTATLEAVGLSGTVFDTYVLDRCAQASDTSPPLVSVSSPAAGATVSGVTTVQASASDDVRVEKVDLFIDGSLYAIDTAAPFTFAWDTSTASTGTHTLELRAYDIAGNRTAATESVVVGSGSTGGLPAGWQSQDIGAVGIAGSASQANGTYVVTGAGADIWGTADAFRYVYRTLTGDGTIVARVASIAGSQAWTKVGVMMRASLSADAAHASMFVTVGKGLAFQRRTSTGGLSTHTAGLTNTAPQWVKLARAGNVITASSSSDGVTWTTVGSDTIQVPATIFVGLAVTSHDATTTATGTLDNVAVTQAAGLPSGWTGRDVGAVGIPGSVTYNSGTFTVQGAGADVWGTTDAFYFVSRTLAGDGDVIARVASATGTQAWTKVGVMMRQTLDPGSAHAFMFVSAAKGLAFQRRTVAGGTSTNTSLTGTAPRWVKLTRQNSVIIASTSTDGVTWTEVGRDTFSISGSMEVGLAVTSHDASQRATGVFDNVTVVAR
jgi:regulation of enolase protein 1 (concanavalin A-like superfamily)